MNEKTLITHTGSNPGKQYGFVNPGLYRGSTIIFPTLKDYQECTKSRIAGLSYGIHGTPTTRALSELVSAMEGGTHTINCSSGMAMLTVALLGLLRQGDHLLVVDSVYWPTRKFCDTVLTRYGVTTSYYPPRAGAGIEEHFQANTRAILLESPGSASFELQDVPAIAKVAHARGAVVLMDNTWATPLFFKPLDHGVDISLQAGTKYIGGHADLLIGFMTFKNEELYRRVREIHMCLGDCVSPEICLLAMRGARSLHPRLMAHQAAGLEVARWLETHPAVKQVLHPALESHPDHAIWKRDFKGATSLFGIILHETSLEKLARMVDFMKIFRMGASWGGYESLILPHDLAGMRTAVPWEEKGLCLRLHIGLEDVEDIRRDLAEGLARLEGKGG